MTGRRRKVVTDVKRGDTHFGVYLLALDACDDRDGVLGDEEVVHPPETSSTYFPGHSRGTSPVRHLRRVPHPLQLGKHRLGATRAN